MLTGGTRLIFSVDLKKLFATLDPALDIEKDSFSQSFKVNPNPSKLFLTSENLPTQTRTNLEFLYTRTR